MSIEEINIWFDTWLASTDKLFRKWQEEEGLTLDECLKRFWGKELMQAWERL